MELKNANDIISDIYGVRTTIALDPETTNVTNAVTKILSLNPRRVALVIINLAATTIYISPRNDVSAASGILVAPNGGAVTLEIKDDFELVNQGWWAIGTAANQVIFIIETLIY